MDKEKQIEEIALDLNNIIHFKDNGLVARYATAEAMYNLNYRKQIFAEWIPHRFDKQGNPIQWYCSNCKGVGDSGTYCSHCGAHMKGGM